MGRIAAHTQERFSRPPTNWRPTVRKSRRPPCARFPRPRQLFHLAHIEAWQQARQAAPAPVILKCRNAVKARFAQCWQAAAAEAGKEIAAIREKADAEIKATKRRLMKPCPRLNGLKTRPTPPLMRWKARKHPLPIRSREAQQAATEAAAREAALSATAEQMRQRRSRRSKPSLRAFTPRPRPSARSQHAAEVARLTGDFSRQLAEQAAAATGRPGRSQPFARASLPGRGKAGCSQRPRAGEDRGSGHGQGRSLAPGRSTQRPEDPQRGSHRQAGKSKQTLKPKPT